MSSPTTHLRIAKKVFCNGVVNIRRDQTREEKLAYMNTISVDLKLNLIRQTWLKYSAVNALVTYIESSKSGKKTFHF